MKNLISKLIYKIFGNPFKVLPLDHIVLSKEHPNIIKINCGNMPTSKAKNYMVAYLKKLREISSPEYKILAFQKIPGSDNNNESDHIVLSKEHPNIIKISVGNMPQTKADAYIDKVTEKLREVCGPNYKVICVAFK